MWIINELKAECEYIRQMIKKLKRPRRKKLIIKHTQMTPELSAALQALATQYQVGLAGTVTPNPVPQPVGEAFDFKP